MYSSEIFTVVQIIQVGNLLAGEILVQQLLKPFCGAVAARLAKIVVKLVACKQLSADAALAGLVKAPAPAVRADIENLCRISVTL